MNSEEHFDQPARRDAALSAVASRGRRRSLVMMVLAFVAIPFVVMLINNDASLSGVIPIGLVCVVAISYSWAKWQRRPEDAQSVAFVGLDRSQRKAAYRSMRRASRIDDAVVLAIVESMHHHLHKTAVAVLTTLVAAAATGIALIAAGGDGLSSPWVPIAIVMLAAGVIAEHRWVIKRASLVIDRSRPL